VTVSIFHKLVTKENSYTQLLCNMMRRDESFFRTLLTLFAGESPNWHFGDQSVNPQIRLRDNCGQPDLIIELTTLCVIVEVKTESQTVRTQKQGLLGTGRSYLNYLKDKHDSGVEAVLTFLVPHNWEFRQEVDDEIATLREEAAEKSVTVNQVFWEEVLERISKEETQTESPLIEEFRLLLAERFGPIRFYPEESKQMFSTEFPMQIVVKLNAVLEGLRQKARKDARRLDIEMYGTRLYSDKNEFGFCLRKIDGTLLYVGYKLQFWNNGHPYPMCFGIPDATPKVQEAFKSAFQDVYKEEAVSLDDKWTMGWVPEGDFNSLNAVDEIWGKLVTIWKKVAAASE
jgi:hypothetical protein